MIARVTVAVARVSETGARLSREANSLVVTLGVLRFPTLAV